MEYETQTNEQNRILMFHQNLKVALNPKMFTVWHMDFIDFMIIDFFFFKY